MENNNFKRPLSHKQLLIFSNESEYLMDNPKEYLKDSQRNEKFSLKELHEKWKRKINVNFKNIDKKFDIKKSTTLKRVKTEQDEIHDKEFFDILHGIYYDNSNKRENIKIKLKLKNGIYDKYDDKYSYYLNNQITWNNNSVFDVKDKKNNEQKILKNIIITNKKNEIINKNNKNYKSLNERYLNRNYLFNEVKNEFIKDKKEELYNKIIYENPDLIKYPEKIKALIFKEMINLFKEYSECIENRKINNLKLSSKHNFTDEEIYDKMQILLAYLKEHKEEINHQKFLEPLIIDYNKILEKEEYLKKLDLELEDNKGNKKNITERRKNIINLFKYPIKEKLKEYRINSFKCSNKEESKNVVNNKNKEINYFLTAYKSVIDEKKEKEKKITKEKKKKGITYIIKEKSNNPYGSFIKSNENKKQNLNIEINNKKLKRPNSSVGTRQINITYYHPGNYSLFKEGENEYNAWSCCLNEDKLSKGCCKKYERILNFLYDI